MDMLAALGMTDLPGVVKVDPAAQDGPKFGGGYAGRDPPPRVGRRLNHYNVDLCTVYLHGHRRSKKP
ncbi:hypothetical protein MKX03_008369 [Papaver bracteatum]|nr:hypothetical protein MKX03_008369 [Papaver bracteatum]